MILSCKGRISKCCNSNWFTYNYTALDGTFQVVVSILASLRPFNQSAQQLDRWLNSSFYNLYNHFSMPCTCSNTKQTCTNSSCNCAICQDCGNCTRPNCNCTSCPKPGNWNLPVNTCWMNNLVYKTLVIPLFVNSLYDMRMKYNRNFGYLLNTSLLIWAFPNPVFTTNRENR